MMVKYRIEKTCILFVFFAMLLAITFFIELPVKASNEVDERYYHAVFLTG